MGNKAWDFATHYHNGQMYGDKPYAYHLQQVADIVVASHKLHSVGTQKLLKDIAYLHDVMEDCGVTYYQLADEFGTEVGHAVELLTKNPDVPYESYIKRLKENFYAKAVKIADTKANLKQSILDDDKHRIVKYAKQLMLLEG